jgi:hypothetical protein
LRRRFDLWKSTAFAKLLVFNAQPFTFRERVGESLFNGKTHLVKLLKSEVKCDSKQSFRGAIARCMRVNRDSMVCRRSARQSIARLIRLRSRLHPPPGSGSLPFRILRPEEFHGEEMNTNDCRSLGKFIHLAGLAFCFGCAIYFLETGRKSGFSPLG